MNNSSSRAVAPRGTRRILYNSDPSGIASHILPDPTEPDDLRAWVDMVGDAGVDTLLQESYNQGYTVYWRSDRFQYDERPQHARFLAMLEGGTQPLQVMLDRAHERGMTFLAGFRMNDTHDSPKTNNPPISGFSAFADFIEEHPDFHLAKRWDVLGIERPPEALTNKGGRPLDYTHEPVRAFIHDAIADLVDRFDVDGIELIFRDPGYFPLPQAQDRLHLMVELVRRVRATLDEYGATRGRRLLLGARVFSTLDECLDLGLDVPSWIADGLLDYCAPMDTMFSDLNAEYAEFCQLAQGTDCMIYPGLHPWTSHRMRKAGAVMSPSMCRAFAQTCYAGGADGISLFNDFVGHLWTPPFYPQFLHLIHELRDPGRVAAGERHYVYDPTWGGVPWSGLDRSTSGALKAQKVTLDRSANRPTGLFRFRLYDSIDHACHATLLIRGSGLTAGDEIELALNDGPLSEGPFGRADPRTRERCPDTRWFPLSGGATSWGENVLSVTLARAAPSLAEDLVLDEVEVWVQPH